MLKLWIEQPLLNERDITARQDAIELTLTQPMAADELREKLKQVCDLERMLSRLAYGTLNARDCLALRRSFEVLPDIARTLDDCHAEGLLSHARAMICDMDKLCRLLTDAISEDAPVTLREGGLFKDGFNEQLDAYRTASREGKHWLSKLEADEREKTGIRTLKSASTACSAITSRSQRALRTRCRTAMCANRRWRARSAIPRRS